jgi:hypothetical protein
LPSSFAASITPIPKPLTEPESAKPFSHRSANISVQIAKSNTEVILLQIFFKSIKVLLVFI